MLKEFKIREGQSLADVALITGGDISYITELMRLNDIGADASIYPGDSLLYDTATAVKKNIVDYYGKNIITPATAGDAVHEGIGYWRIERDFVIS